MITAWSQLVSTVISVKQDFSLLFLFFLFFNNIEFVKHLGWFIPVVIVFVLRLFSVGWGVVQGGSQTSERNEDHFGHRRR